ncbi:hypothetical protein BG011_009490 [Mortierella polycephala]|uniref:Uncharacterized protein n=1 Tax=Mortierella polycephala TaxID=41804 RepID=A0A9P6TVQ2_9FUNG|nr:hypothetical protein BG011_009490 [Mortierella polycephala]
MQRQPRLSHTDIRRLETMFPPLYDSTDENELGVMPQRPVTPNNNKIARQPHLLPPPLLIPKDASQQQQKHQHRPTGQSIEAEALNHQQKQQKQKQQLPSPVSENSMPESPSSLAIHLYVHHHHHLHSPEPSPTISATAPSVPMVLLSPLAIPLSPSLEQESEAVASLPSPSSPTPAEVILPSAPLISPSPGASLLPPLSISNRIDPNQPEARSGVRIPLNISPTTPNENDPSLLPWFKYPSSLVISNSVAQVQKQLHQRRHRQCLAQLPDPMFANQLLSTISSDDLARLYVHAAHHLHSHQPIRRFVLMKMIMTQAELVQYGRLRAEMPRAPGPSTGAQPKRTGFGSEANTGLGARPKISSKLSQFVRATECTPRLPSPPFTTMLLSGDEATKINIVENSNNYLSLEHRHVSQKRKHSPQEHIPLQSLIPPQPMHHPLQEHHILHSQVLYVSSNKFKHARRRISSPSSLVSCSLPPSLTSSPSEGVSPSMEVLSQSSSSLPWLSWAYTESYGVSGLLMLSLFIFFLFLLKGTDLFHNLQFAFLYIVL